PPAMEPRPFHHLAVGEAFLHRMRGQIALLRRRLLLIILPVLPLGRAVVVLWWLRSALLRMLRVGVGRMPVGLLLVLPPWTVWPCRLRKSLRRLPVLVFAITRRLFHAQPRARHAVAARQPDQTAHGREIDPPPAIAGTRAAPAGRSATTPKQREQVVKHVCGPAP